MTPKTLQELDRFLAENPDYVAAERDLRPDLGLASEVIALRVDAGWTQAQLADAVGTNQANISRLESALANPTLKFLKKVARSLGAELDIRLRRPADIASGESMESFIDSFKASTSRYDGAMDWQSYASARTEFEVSTRSDRPC